MARCYEEGNISPSHTLIEALRTVLVIQPSLLLFDDLDCLALASPTSTEDEELNRTVSDFLRTLQSNSVCIGTVLVIGCVEKLEDLHPSVRATFQSQVISESLTVEYM